MLPNIHFHKRFKPFVEDELPALTRDVQAFVAHPYNPQVDLSSNIEIKGLTNVSDDNHALIAIGPEGGFIPYEIEMLQKAGLTPLGFGERIYRVETFVPLILGKLS